MKKGAILLMATFLFTVGPAVIQAHAEEIDKPDGTLNLVTKKLSSLTENILDQSQKTDSPNISKRNETNNANANPALLREPQSSKEAGNTNRSGNVTAESVPSEIKKATDPNLTANSQAIQETQVKSSTKQTVNTFTAKVDNITDSKANLLSGGLDLPLVGNVNVNLLSNRQNSTGTISASNTELLGIGIANSAILGDVNIDLLSNEQSSNGSGSGSLAKVGLKNGLGQTHVGVMETTKVVSNDTIKTNCGLLITDIKDTIFGNSHLGVGQIDTIETPLYKELNSRLLNVNINSPLLGMDHLGLVEFHQIQSDESSSIAGGLVILGLQNSLLGDTHIGIGEFSNTEMKLNPSLPGGNPVYDNPIAANPLTDIPKQSSGLTTANPKQPTNPYKDKGNNEGYQNLNKVSQPSSAIDDNHVSKSDSADEFIQKVTDAGSKTSLKQNIENNYTLFGNNDNPITNNSSNDALQLALSSASTTTNNSSPESGSGGSTSLGGGSVVNCLFDLSYQKELDMKNHVQFILQELSDEWIKAPPIKPPQAAFFLSM